MLPATSWVHYTTSCNTQSSAPEDGQNNCLKPFELTGIINKPLLLYLVGCLYYLYKWCTIKKISDNEIYLLIKYIKSILWRAAKRLSYIQDARCLKVNPKSYTPPEISNRCLTERKLHWNFLTVSVITCVSKITLSPTPSESCIKRENVSCTVNSLCNCYRMSDSRVLTFACQVCV